ncbi:MAG TPA: ABC transporter permease [Chloroflexota bacterium]|nr:ABC transporter permease [Chloroflexota bacterium]
MLAFTRNLRVIRAVAIKDIKSSLTERAFTMVSLIIPLNFLLLFLLFVLTGGQAPTAVVLEERGPYAQQFLAAMEHAHSFIIQEASAGQAAALMQRGKIVAIVTVPADFDAALRAGQRVQLPVLINNLDVDFTNDIRRAVPLAITSFYTAAFPEQVVVQAREVDSYRQDTGYVAYLAVSILVVGLMIGGLLQAGTNAAREYERGTIKELLLAPVSPWVIQAGKVLGALAMNALGVLVVLAVIVLVLRVRPVNWGATLAFALLLMVMFVALGTLFGTLVQRRQAVVPLSIGLALPVFFLSGAFGPANWGDPVVATVARFEPVYYGIAVFQQAFHGFQTTQTSAAANTIILLAFALAAVALSAGVLRRRGTAH